MGFDASGKKSGGVNAAAFLPSLEHVIFYTLFVLAYVLALWEVGTGGIGEHLSLPLALGVAVAASLRFRMRGVITLLSIQVLLSGAAYLASWGCFEEGVLPHPLFFLIGMLCLFSAVNSLAAIVAGYHLRSVALVMQRQNMLDKIFNSLPIGIWVCAPNGETVMVNDRWASFSDYSTEDILRSDSIATPVDLGPSWAEAFQELLASPNAPTHYQTVDLKDKNGRHSSMTLLTSRIYIDQIEDYGVLVLLIDETALRVYEEKVWTSEHSLRVALQNAEMGLWDQNLDTGKVICDSNWFRILGLEREGIQDAFEIWKERVHPDDRERVEASYRQYFKSTEGSLQIDYRIRKGATDYIWVQDLAGVVERREDGSIRRIMSTMQDISERKQAEIELKHAKEKAEAGDKAKGQFIATISHEIRTPLNAIIGLSSFLAESDLNEDQHELTQTIYNSGNSLLMLVNDILDFSKIEAGRLDLEIQEFPLHLCFEDCVKLFKVRANEKQVSLQLEIDSGLPEFAIGDMERLRQIVQNLLSNALKFTDAGTVKIRARSVELSELPEERRPDPLEPIGYLDQPNHHYLEVLVEDSGIGIPKDRQHALFEAFTQVDASTTRKYGGTGLGLVICKRLVDAMGGSIWLESEEGGGTVFGFVVRTQLVYELTQHATLTRSPFSSVERISEKHPCDLLIVGPKDETAYLLNSCRRLGYVPHHAASYDLSSGAFQRRQYKIIFIWMGDQHRAFDLVREICANQGLKKSAAIIGVIAQKNIVSRERCKLSGMRDLIEGPARPEIVKETIMSVLGVHG